MQEGKVTSKSILLVFTLPRFVRPLRSRSSSRKALALASETLSYRFTVNLKPKLKETCGRVARAQLPFSDRGASIMRPSLKIFWLLKFRGVKSLVPFD